MGNTLACCEDTPTSEAPVITGGRILKRGSIGVNDETSYDIPKRTLSQMDLEKKI